ncbi:hypothetical protein LUZ60_015367 [Juncus effusus]|nr:hypothetical protein LUZ60_015367 [Juncus effusus]
MNGGSPTVRVSVSHGPKQYQLAVPLQFTFGDLKKELAKECGLNPEDQRLLFRGKERENSELLHSAGVKDTAKMMLLESFASKERKLAKERREKERKLEEERETQERKIEDEKKMQEISRSLEKISLVRTEVDKLANKVSGLEMNVNERKKIDEKEFTILPELLMIQLLKLDGIEAEGEARLQRKNEVKRIQNLVEKVDSMKVKYHSPFNDGNKSVEITTQWETFDNGSGLDQESKPVTKTTENWERFD